MIYVFEEDEIVDISELISVPFFIRYDYAVTNSRLSVLYPQYQRVIWLFQYILFLSEKYQP